ncbi:PaaI family thioesterase [Nonomuraea sp. LPB2021202275-12-8]|uniref:PaaI family thioesterase n=1 Tax=Nonomuraea sp. LPB2021202275-12-8 TaxID=3120159 RepID=UPI00300C5881
MTIETATGEARVEALCALAEQTRELMEAVAMTGVAAEELAAVTAELRALTDRLDAAGRTAPHPFEIAPDGSVRTLGNAVIGAGNPFAFPLVVERLAEGGVRAAVTFRPLHEGPPGAVHGGISAMVLDHLLGQAAAAAGFAGMTATLSMSYRAPVPYGTPVVATARHTRAEGRKSWSDGRLSLPDGTLLVEATGLFVTPAAWVRDSSGRVSSPRP